MIMDPLLPVVLYAIGATVFGVAIAFATGIDELGPWQWAGMVFAAILWPASLMIVVATLVACAIWDMYHSLRYEKEIRRRS